LLLLFFVSVPFPCSSFRCCYVAFVASALLLLGPEKREHCNFGLFNYS
jgi:hypothetical protein